MTLLHLVGHDGTSHGDDALALARTIGQGRDVRRLVVHAIRLPGPTTVAGEAWIANLSSDEQEHVRRIREMLNADETLEVIIAGSPARGLHDRAEELEADLVAVGSRTWEPLGRELTAVANRLLSGGPCAVIHAPAGYAERVRPLARIVVGYDGSPEAGDALAEAAGLAAASGALVDVVHAHEEAAAYLGYPAAVYVTPDELELAEQRAERTAAEALETLPEALRGVSAARLGTPGAVVDAFALEQDADLVVLGSRGYGPLRRTLLGSASGHVLRHADRPVLVLPRGTHATVPAAARPLFAAAR